MIVFQPCIILTNSLVGECEEDDPDPPEVTKHSKHDVAPICPLKIFPVSIPNVASSCQDSSASIYLGNQAGNIFMVEDLLMGAGWRVEHDWFSCQQSCPSECSEEFPQLPVNSVQH